MTIRVVTDSNCDLPPDLVKEHGIAVVPLHINVGRESYLDGVEMSRQQFYEGLPSFKTHPTTSVPSPGEFYQVYRRLADEGADQILSIHISVALSAVVNSARLAAEELPDLPVTVYDSGNLTLGTGFQVLAAAHAAGIGRHPVGKDPEEHQAGLPRVCGAHQRLYPLVPQEKGLSQCVAWRHSIDCE